MADTQSKPRKSSSQSPSGGSPRSNPATAPIHSDLDPVAVRNVDEEGENDSALGDDDAQVHLASASPAAPLTCYSASSTASISSSILEYRTIQGRTFHSERFNTEYFTPNDEQQRESVDITHHYLTLLLEGKLYLAPLEKAKIKKVLDVGTGTGIWAIDFADEFPHAEVIGTDLSPIQPSWVPPNVMFELEDATDSWSWPDNTFDFVHMRYLVGAIADWGVLFKEAYRSCAPGGYVESGEVNPKFYSDDGTGDKDSALRTWNHLFDQAGERFGRSFCGIGNDVQKMREAGFVDIQAVDYKVPVGGWARDPKLREAGKYLCLTIENDLEGYTLMAWHNIMAWPKDEYQAFLMDMRRALKSKNVHSYMHVRYVYGRKPDAEEA